MQKPAYESVPTYLIFRYFLDQVIAIIGIILLLPIYLVIFIAVRADGGPAIFTQPRVGLNGNIFRIFKFRSMVVNADAFLDENGMPTRKRTTRVGDFIRRTSLDEIPQLFNIALGQMAIVGPRPILPNMLPYLTSQERRRLVIKPGVTGLAQIRGRNFMKWSRRLRLDCVYLKRASVFLDLAILWKTVVMVLKATDVAQDRNGADVDDVRNRRLR